MDASVGAAATAGSLVAAATIKDCNTGCGNSIPNLDASVAN